MAIYYSSHNAAGGGVGSIADPFTLQELVDTVTTGDTGLIMNTGTYTPAATVDFDTNNGANNNPICIRGANADGSDDGSVVTISGSSLPAGNSILNINSASMMLVLSNIILDASKLYGINMPSAGSVSICGVTVTNSTSHGVYCTDSSGIVPRFVGCTFDNNGGAGYSVNAAARGKAEFLLCEFSNNDGGGCVESVGTIGTIEPSFTGCYFYKNTGYGLQVIGNTGYGKTSIVNCVFYGNTSDGINIAAEVSEPQITNCILRSNGAYGINTNSGALNNYKVMFNNCSNGNTSGHIDINSGVLPGSGNVTTDPLFVSETAGSEDFNLQSSSPCKNAGFGYS